MSSNTGATSLPELSGLLARLEAEPGATARHDVLRKLLEALAGQKASDQLVALFARIAFSVHDQPITQPLVLDTKSKTALFHQLRDGEQSVAAIQGLTILFLLDVVGRGPDFALTEFVNVQAANKSWDDNGIEFFCRTVVPSGIYSKTSDDFRDHLRSVLISRAAAGDLGFCLKAMYFAGLSFEVPLEDRIKPFEQLYVPLLRDICQRGDDVAALHLESFVYSAHIKRTETPGHHAICWSQVAPLTYAVGRKALTRRATNAVVARVAADRLKIAFFLHNTFVLAHTELLLTYLRAWRLGGGKMIDPVVFSLAGEKSSPLQEELSRLGIPLILGTDLYSDPSPAIRLNIAKQAFERDGIAAIVFVSLPLFMAYAAGIELAPEIIWWPMKFPLSTFPMVDARIQTRTLYKAREQIDGQLWCFGPPFHQPPAAPDATEVAAIRVKYAGRTILGTIAREEKINSGGFLPTIITILQRHPQTCFLWTGRTELQAITEAFAAAGVADRCHFIGWVDPRLYCGVFDIYLDTFPLSGTMAIETMHAGVPVISHGTNGAYNYLATDPDGRLPYGRDDQPVLAKIFGALEQEVGQIWCDEVDAYLERADRLISDAALRQRFAAAGKEFVDRFLFRPDYAADIFTQHFHELAQAGQQKSAQGMSAEGA